MTVSRRAALALGGSAVLAPGLSLRSFAQPRLAYDIVPKQIAYGLWMIQGTTEYFTRQNGGAIVNCVLLETDDGMLVIDSGPSLRYGEALRLAINQMGDGKIAGVINTHHHPDHFLGNQAFEDAPIFALGETKALAIEHGDAFTDNMYNLLGDWMRGTESRPPDQDRRGHILIGWKPLLKPPPLKVLIWEDNMSKVSMVVGGAESTADVVSLTVNGKAVAKAVEGRTLLQCGFCTPGMIMTAADMIARHGGNLDEATVRAELEGNICRCTGYHNIVKSILAANADMHGAAAAE